MADRFIIIAAESEEKALEGEQALGSGFVVSKAYPGAQNVPT